SSDTARPESCPLSLHDALPICRGEVVAVVPLHALTDTQRVFGGVVVDLPAFKQHAADRAVDFVLDQIVEPAAAEVRVLGPVPGADRKSTRLNSSHVKTSYAVFC